MVHTENKLIPIFLTVHWKYEKLSGDNYPVEDGEHRSQMGSNLDEGNE